MSSFSFTLGPLCLVKTVPLQRGPANQPSNQLFPESPTRFFFKVAPLEVEFFPNDKGEITSLTVYQNGQQFKADKTN